MILSKTSRIRFLAAIALCARVYGLEVVGGPKIPLLQIEKSWSKFESNELSFAEPMLELESSIMPCQRFSPSATRNKTRKVNCRKISFVRMAFASFYKSNHCHVNVFAVKVGL
mmetsp:Transcript_3746/g.7553  ORF Transcript_3746/g.7553 Transcript_3746/m.7553 type:complete len:113 (-) Transcript_3746:347-685(-)